MLKALLLVAVLTLFAPAALGQDTLPDDLCTTDGAVLIASRLVSIAEMLKRGDDVDSALVTAQALIASYRADCAGLTFTSTEYGDDVVTDPVLFPSGFYRVTLESDAYAIAHLVEIEGDCDFVYPSTPVNGGRDQVSGRLDGCIGVIEASGRNGWSLTFEPVALTP